MLRVVIIEVFRSLDVSSPVECSGNTSPTPRHTILTINRDTGRTAWPNFVWFLKFRLTDFNIHINLSHLFDFLYLNGSQWTSSSITTCSSHTGPHRPTEVTGNDRWYNRITKGEYCDSYHSKSRTSPTRLSLVPVTRVTTEGCRSFTVSNPNSSPEIW